MLTNIINLIFISQFSAIILFVVFIILILIGIFFFIYNQLTTLLKSDKNTYNELLDPLNVEELNKELEPFGFAYNWAKDSFYSIMYPWQRDYGYCKSYDEASPLLSMIIDCEPIYFNYDNRQWLIEFWKGQYGMTTGGEIGVYVTSNSPDQLINEVIYDSASDKDRLLMSYTLKKKNKVLITRRGLHWWLTGFKLGEFSKPSKLTMDIEISLKDKIMRDSFIDGLKKAGYANEDIKVFNNTIYLTFDKPHTKQPDTRNKLIMFIMQQYNKSNCKLYNSITKKYNNSLDKINYIRETLPILYYQLIDFGKNEQLFKYYRPTISTNNYHRND